MNKDYCWACLEDIEDNERDDPDDIGCHYWCYNELEEQAEDIKEIEQ